MGMRASINGFTSWSNTRLATVSGLDGGDGEGAGRRWGVRDILREIMEGSTMKLLLQSET